MSKRNAIVVLENDVLTVGPAVSKRADKPLDRSATNSLIVELEDPGNPAHYVSSPSDLL